MTERGRFYGIGVGPGDPELLTLKAARILTEVDWIFLSTTTPGGRGLAGSIIEFLKLDVRKFRPVLLSMSKQRNIDLVAYAHAARAIESELHKGKSAAWIAEGDPLFYSTFFHLLQALCQLNPAVQVEIVPGVTSIQAAAACVGVPVACLDEKVAIVPATYGLDHLADLVAQFPAVFLLKVSSVWDELLERLAKLSSPVEVYYVEKVGMAEQRIVRDVQTLRGEKVPYFSLVILRRPREEKP